MQLHNVVVEKVLQYKIITDHPNTNAIRMKLILVQNGLTYTTKTLFKDEEKVLHDPDAKRIAKVTYGISTYPAIFNERNDFIGGYADLENWVLDFEKK